MTYNPNIPNTIDSPASQQAGLQVNFAQFAAIYSSTSGGVIYNHMPINGSQQGKHAAVLINQVGPNPGVTSDYTTLYAKNVNSNVGAGVQLFTQIKTFLTNGILNFPMQLTFDQVNTAGPQYQTFLPGGYTLYIGSSVINTTITLVPAPKTLLCIQATSNKMTSVGTATPIVASVQKLTNSTFQIKSDNAANTDQFAWFAIGNINS